MIDKRMSWLLNEEWRVPSAQPRTTPNDLEVSAAMKIRRAEGTRAECADVPRRCEIP